MTCKRCGVKMAVDRHRPHKQEKWRCPRCGRIRFRRQRSRSD